MSNKRIYPLKSEDLWRVVDYFYSADDELLKIMGVDKSKLLPKDEWQELLERDFRVELIARKKYYLGWEYNGVLFGHSNISNIEFGNSAMAHMHIWIQKKREQGLGTWFFKNSINHYFDKFNLRKINCEPCASNSPPNKVLQKLGLMPVKQYETIPGWINFKQIVTRYEISSPFDE